MQHLTFCGVGAHHQNGVAERIIKDLTLSSRTLVLNAQCHWPEYITIMFWPYALVASADRMNNLHVDMNGKTPEMKFSNTIGSSTCLSNFHTFGYPVYILDARLQSDGGTDPPKWEPRACLGIYLGHSPSHAGRVALVMNPKSGLVSPQFHLVFDNIFETVPHLRADTVPDSWEDLVASSKEKSVEGLYDVTQTWFEGQADTSADPQAAANHPTSSSAASQPNGGSVSFGGPPYPITPDNGLVCGFEPSGNPQQMNDSHPNLEVPQTGGIISPNVIPDNGHLEPCSDNSPDNPPTPPLPPGLEETDCNNVRHIDFGENSNMPPIVDLATAGLQRLARLAGKLPNKKTGLSCATVMKCFCAFGIPLALLWSSGETTLHS